ncbi:MAG TPA: glycine--tRNA ligase subunit beta [Clostridia bacterium]|nr:glycine--tRNA ligase subunit beta [Clostridia bacterium]
MPEDLLLEIGTEEIPARFMSPALAELKQLAAELLDKERLGFREIKTYGTPRRLVLYVYSLEEVQADIEEEVKGPPTRVAFDSEGNPTKAAQGFARNQGVDVSQLKTGDVGGTSYVFALRREKGKAALEILPQLLPQLIKGLSFPKPMRWGSNEIRFARPIRWIVSLYGNKEVKFTYAGVTAGRSSRGHRFLSSGEITIDNPEEYLKKMEKAYVIVDQNKRKEMIWQQVQETAAAQGGNVQQDDDLLEEVTYLLEYPTALCGSFSKNYLELPEEVLITSMREHQRYFPVFGKDGRMLNKFITVRNGNTEYLDTVREGNEKVLRARLADAQFFFNEDRKTNLADKVDRLKNVVFQEQLGTIYEKCARMQKLVVFLAERLGVGTEVKAAAYRAAFLSKADLVTNMVIEFPELQGIMGYYYSAFDGEREDVSIALREQYLPRFSGDVLPETEAGCLLSIADKIDNIVGCFALGIQPTGSQDPYALRRQALGICHIIARYKFEITFTELFRETYKQYAEKVHFQESYENTEKALAEFFHQRVVNIMEESGFRHDTIQAVLAAGWDNLPDALSRGQALREFRQDPGFEALLTGFTRAAHLAQKAPGGTVDPSLLEDSAETALYSALQDASVKARQYIEKGDYLRALREISHLREPIDTFFDSVMVMVDEEKVRNNRLALLAAVSGFMGSVADLSHVQPAQ